MPINQKLTDRAEAASATNDALIHIVEPDDISQSPDGSSYKITKQNYLLGVATQAYVDNEVDILNDAIANKIDSVVAGTNITVDDTDPLNPIISASVGGAVDSVNGQTGIVVLDTGDIADSTNKRYQTDNQNTYNDATSSIQTQLNTKENIVSGVAASGTDTYTATYSPTIAYTDGLKVIIRFTNANTGASTININSLGAKSIVKGVSTALVSGDIVAGATLLLVYNGTNFVAVSGLAVSGGGAETFSILWCPDGVYGEPISTFPVLNTFRRSTFYSFQNSFVVNNAGTGLVDTAGAGFVVPYDCYLYIAICRITYSGGNKRDFEVFTQCGESRSSPGQTENTNRTTLINDRINNGVTGYASADTTVNFLNIIDVDFLIPAGYVIKHMMASKGNTGDYVISLQYFFKKA
jgi:hypothetical protein